MATRTPQFAVVPTLPQQGLQPWQYAFYTAVKQNIEMLTGTADSTLTSNKAVVHSGITVAAPVAQKMTTLTAKGAAIGLVDEKQSVPVADDYGKLMSDVQSLANDVANLRATVEVLIKQLKGPT